MLVDGLGGMVLRIDDASLPPSHSYLPLVRLQGALKVPQKVPSSLPLVVLPLSREWWVLLLLVRSCKKQVIASSVSSTKCAQVKRGH
ncbi:unnamed protein product [Hydatigera taeniaeformis]|uniref:Uncharacterized protein n=1 Tax=Hydatigena taeniaeformis TaxID=6205 RepID=A0A3P7FC32_HYDTA|nr:unnamed protein product [Hydatigera taeniaeformis]